jgi:hypothetical protein
LTAESGESGWLAANLLDHYTEGLTIQISAELAIQDIAMVSYSAHISLILLKGITL